MNERLDPAFEIAEQRNFNTIACDIWGDCLLGRHNEAIKLERFIARIHNPTRTSGHTMNIDAKCGEGKTTFLRKWEKQLRLNHPVIFIDAWESDFLNNPILALFAALDKLEIKGHSRIEKALERIKTMIPHALDITARNLLNSSIKELTALGASKKEQILDTYHQEIDTLRTLKDELKHLSDTIREDETLELPIYILIDELDRCRPNYAIELLEQVKHIFNVRGFQFIFASNTEQLMHTVKSIYGIGFDAHAYLNRFFDTIYHFPKIAALPHAKILFSPRNSDIKEYLYVPELTHDIELLFSHFSDMFELSIQDRMHIFEKLEHIAKYQFTEFSLHVTPILFYLCMKHKYPINIFRKLSQCRSMTHCNTLLKEHKLHQIKDCHSHYISTQLNVEENINNDNQEKISMHDIIDFYLFLKDKNQNDYEQTENAINDIYHHAYQQQLHRHCHQMFHSNNPTLSSYPELAMHMGGLSI